MTAQTPNEAGTFSCPLPLTEYPYVLLAHGGGGKLGQRLVEGMFIPRFASPALEELHDGAVLQLEGGSVRIAFSTDSYVVNPIFFPGGSIGDLAVYGTVNDLAMCGAQPVALSVGFIIEEGLPMDDLWRVTLAMEEAARRAGVAIVTGDTKVVDRGKGDKLFLTTSGIGLVPEGVRIAPRRAAPGDTILISGRIAEHGIAILSVREGLSFGTSLASDTAPLNGLVNEMLSVCPDIHVLRDPTRGGVTSALNEIAQKAGVGMMLEERAIPVGEEVKGACELLGLDPLYVANEGKLLAIVPPKAASGVLAAMRNHPLGKEAALIGTVTQEKPGLVLLQSTAGGTRVLDMISGEQLPRIC